MTEYLDIEVTLLDVTPAIWRRLRHRSQGTLLDLHQAIQALAGWKGKHLYQFRKSRGGSALAGGGGHYPRHHPPRRSAGDVPLTEVFAKAADEILYWYDPGDQWYCRAVLVGTAEVPEVFHRRLLGGARAFPVEHCGGVDGYRLCLQALHPARADSGRAGELARWLAEKGWQAEAFDLAGEGKRFDA